MMNDLKSSDYPEIEKVRPSAEVRYSSEVRYSCGIYGRDAGWVIDYSCPNCRKPINKGDIACDRCGTFFDWSKMAHIRWTNPEIVWE